MEPITPQTPYTQARLMVSIMGVEYKTIASDLDRHLRAVAGWMRGDVQRLPATFVDWLNTRWQKFSNQLQQFRAEAITAEGAVQIIQSRSMNANELVALQHAQIAVCESLGKDWTC